MRPLEICSVVSHTNDYLNTRNFFSFTTQSLNLWDCGGQEAFMENYFTSQRENIFRNVEVTYKYYSNRPI